MNIRDVACNKQNSKYIPKSKLTLYNSGSSSIFHHYNKMTPEKRTERLHELMQQHGMDAADVGAILGRSAQTVRSWRSKYEHRVIPAHTLTALEAVLKARKTPTTKAG